MQARRGLRQAGFREIPVKKAAINSIFIYFSSTSAVTCHWGGILRQQDT